MKNCRVDLVTERGAFECLRGEWNALLETTGSNSLFLTWEWIHTWWDIYGHGKTLHILTARQPDGRLIGLAPLMCVRSRIMVGWATEAVQFIGAGGDVTPEQLQFIVAPEHENAVIDAFAAHLCADSHVRVIDLRPLAGSSPTRARLEAWMANEPGGLRCVRDSVCPVLPLPATPQEFLAHCSRNYRKKMGEYERRCERDLHARLRVSATPDELRRDMASLITLHRKRWNGQSRAFRSANYVQFHERLAAQAFERGWTRLYTLETDGSPVALLYCFFYGKRFYFYQGGRDPDYAGHRVGLIIMHKVIQAAITEGATVFDFLRGEEPYKYRWAKTAVESVRLVHWKSLPAWVGANVHETLQQFRGAPAFSLNTDADLI